MPCPYFHPNKHHNIFCYKGSWSLFPCFVHSGLDNPSLDEWTVTSEWHGIPYQWEPLKVGKPCSQEEHQTGVRIASEEALRLSQHEWELKGLADCDCWRKDHDEQLNFCIIDLAIWGTKRNRTFRFTVAFIECFPGRSHPPYRSPLSIFTSPLPPLSSALLSNLLSNMSN